MAIRNTTHVLKNSDIVNRPLPGSLLKGEPIVNTADGILYFSGVTTSTSEWTPAGTGTTANFFEVGSNLYDLRLRNQITQYQGVSGSGLIGKFLSGTSTGFVLADISDINGISGFTYNPTSNTFTITDASGDVYSATIQEVSGLTINGNLTVTGTTDLSGLTQYAQTVSGTNPLEIANVAYVTGFAQTVDVYVTGNTYNGSTDSSNATTYDLLYHGTPLGGPYSLSGEDTYTTGGTYNNSTKLITFDRNDTSSFTVDLSNIDTNDTYVTGGTNNAATVNTNVASISLLYNQDIAPGTYSLPYTDVFTTGGTYDNNTKLITFDRNDTTNYSVDLSTLDIHDTYVTGFTYNPTNNTFTISQNEGEPNLNASIDTVSGLTVSNLTQGRVVYVGPSGSLTDEAGFTYNDGTDTLGVTNIDAAGDVTIQGSLTVFGPSVSAFTSNLYVEDSNISLNYNPTGSTTITSVGAGWTIQDGSGISNTATTINIGVSYLNSNLSPNTEYTASTGNENRNLFTQLGDIIIRNTNYDPNSPDGVRLLAEGDILSGGFY